MTLNSERHSDQIEFENGSSQPVTYDVIEFGDIASIQSGVRYVVVHDYHLPLELNLLEWVQQKFPGARAVHPRLQRRLAVLTSNDPENFVALIP